MSHAYPSRSQHLRSAYRQLEHAKDVFENNVEARSIPLPPGERANREESVFRDLVISYAQATAHFAAAAIPDLESLQQKIVVS